MKTIENDSKNILSCVPNDLHMNIIEFSFPLPECPLTTLNIHEHLLNVPYYVEHCGSYERSLYLGTFINKSTEVLILRQDFTSARMFYILILNQGFIQK